MNWKRQSRDPIVFSLTSYALPIVRGEMKFSLMQDTYMPLHPPDKGSNKNQRFPDEGGLIDQLSVYEGAIKPAELNTT